MKTVAYGLAALIGLAAGGSRLERSHATRAGVRWWRRWFRHDRGATRFRRPKRRRNAGQSWRRRIAVEPGRGREPGRAVRQSRRQRARRRQHEVVRHYDPHGRPRRPPRGIAHQRERAHRHARRREHALFSQLYLVLSTRVGGSDDVVGPVPGYGKRYVMPSCYAST